MPQQGKALRAALVQQRRVRTAQGRAGESSAGIIDSQSVKGADTVGRESRGYDAGKKINGRKRFIVTDTLGLLPVVCVMAASAQDRDGVKTTLLSACLVTPIRFVFADADFAGALVEWSQRI
ncbi:transposase [Sphaerimonospora mesophila]|uniref:transposase n=1 Tax=Sphaerimonospora mesophila TaxID=37483 RepID=UPI0009FB8BA0